MNAGDDDQVSPSMMIHRGAIKRALVLVGLCIFTFAALSRVDVTNLFGRRELDQRTAFKLGGDKAKINKIREKDKLLRAEAEGGPARDLDAERRWGLGEGIDKTVVKVEKQVNAELVSLKENPVKDEIDYKEYERNITDWTWRPSHQNITKFRDELRAANVDVRGRFVTSNATRKEGGVMTTYLTRENVTLTHIFTRYQAAISPFEGTTFKKCSVVGNSGLLINSACGRAIDDADYVFRINAPEMDPYIQDVGYKTDFTTLNPSIFKRKYNYFATTKLTDKFNNDVSQFQGLLMLPCFSDEAWVPICTRALQRLTPKKGLGVAFGDPDQFSLIRDYWVTKGLSKYPSTGLYLTTAALVLCNEVHLYGFWPFVDSSMPHVTTHPVKYHYFDDIHMVRTHDMHAEFDHLTRLHKAGALRLHIRGCEHETGGTPAAKSGPANWPLAAQPQTIDIEKLWKA